jgi:hypothetical protein
MPMATESRDVALAIPAKPGYLVLARLALAAVCRLTTLTTSEVADLKLAITEAAGDFVVEEDDEDHRVDFSFDLGTDRLVLALTGTGRDEPVDEQELRHAIIEATVDEVVFETDRTTLVKYD